MTFRYERKLVNWDIKYHIKKTNKATIRYQLLSKQMQRRTILLDEKGRDIIEIDNRDAMQTTWLQNEQYRVITYLIKKSNKWKM